MDNDSIHLENVIHWAIQTSFIICVWWLLLLLPFVSLLLIIVSQAANPLVIWAVVLPVIVCPWVESIVQNDIPFVIVVTIDTKDVSLW